MVTALSEKADRLKGLEAGADDFLTKPINDMALFARVKSLVRIKQLLDEVRRSAFLAGRGAKGDYLQRRINQLLDDKCG
jgi:two-component system cell cycle response regulator